VQPGQITLIEGRVTGAPTDYRTSIRVRALTDSRFGAPRPGEALFALQISPEPRLRWQRLIGVTVERAIDDRGQRLSEPMSATGAVGVPGADEPVVFAGGRGGAMMARKVYMPYPYANNALHHYAPVRLTKGALPARLLKEVTGVVTAEVLADAKALLVVDNVLAAKGKTVTGKEGGKIKIHEVQNLPGGQVVVRFDFEQVPNTVPEVIQVPFVNPVPVIDRPIRPRPPIRRLPAVPAGKGGAAKGFAVPAVAVAKLEVAVPAVMPAGGGFAPAVMRMPYQPMNQYGLALVDDKGNTLPANVYITFRGGVGPLMREYQLNYTPQAGHGKVAKLVYLGRQSVGIAIPFTLKDVRLP
jgi:hypothetical protein